jgi:hypothetical protein
MVILGVWVLDRYSSTLAFLIQSLLEPEQYLSCVTNRQHRVAFSGLRLSSHNLEMETGRQHLLYHCQLYDAIRKSCDLIDIFNTKTSQHGHVSILQRLCKFTSCSWLSKEENIHWNCLRSRYCAICQTFVYKPVSVYNVMCMHDNVVINDCTIWATGLVYFMNTRIEDICNAP